MTHPNNFAIYYAGDAYSTANKIMGRQSAGKAFMRGVARTWPEATLQGVGPGTQNAQTMFNQLRQDGFRGKMQWINIPDWHNLAASSGCLYYPSPTAKEIAFSRNAYNPTAFSIMGVTFTLSSAGAMDQVADLILPPFKPWDALICISQAALDLVNQLHDEMKIWWSSQTGATRFNAPQLPVIPLGVNCPAYAPQAEQRLQARHVLGCSNNETVFLFAGRLSFHAKANPAPVYQALEQVAQQTSTPIVCMEAGVFPNNAIRNSFLTAQKALAPSVRFIWVDGNDEAGYRQAWQGADVFVSLSDNIQETFGLTPVEAMAAGLPVVVSDWNGYKDTVRDGIDGFRIPTALPPGGMGNDLAQHHGLEIDTYDLYIGRTSLATVIDPISLVSAFTQLATQPALRATMGAAGLARAQAMFDWPIILQRYAQLVEELGKIRAHAKAQSMVAMESWVTRSDPFSRFAHFPSQIVQANWIVTPQADAQARLRDLLQLAMANYAFHPILLAQEGPQILLTALGQQTQTVQSLLIASNLNTPMGMRTLMWLWKFNLLQITPPKQAVLR